MRIVVHNHLSSKTRDAGSWDLYGTDTPGYVEATQALNSAWSQAKGMGSAREAEKFMLRVMTKYKNVGALDSEPLTILASRLRRVFGRNAKFEHNWRV